MPHALDILLPRPRPWIMGVVNVTPDSFSDGGLHLDPVAAVAQGRLHAEGGADILDLGAESTAPGSRPLDGTAERARLLPVVRGLVGTRPLSIDTYRADTAAACLALGAVIVNDVSALRADPDMGRVVAEHGATLVMMHAKDGPLPHATDRPRHYRDVVVEIGDFLLARAEVAMAAGIPAERLVLDPGWGRFVSLEPAHSFELLGRFEELVARLAPFPLVVGTSRKGFLGLPMARRDPVSQLTAMVAAAKGAAIVRTHDATMAADFLDAWRRMGQPLPSASEI